MYRADYVKPDGRGLWLYARGPMAAIPAGGIPVPDAATVTKATHLRWHPLLGEWVIYAGHRQDRTFLPPAGSNPLAPTTDPSRLTELPAGDWEVAVFENRFPSLAADPGNAPDIPAVETARGFGRCEVVVFAQDAETSLGQLPVESVALILEVWADRTRAMTDAGCAYVLPFENRGVEMGVTLTHPHGQIYGYGFLPATQARTAGRLAEYRRNGGDLTCDLAEAERRDGTRLLAGRATATAFVPPFARFPFETWIVPRRPVPDLAALSLAERDDIASLLGDVLRRLDGLWNRPMPYLMTVNQAPPGRTTRSGWTVRIEIWPIRRAPDKLKYLAGTELGASVFASDMTPEAAAEKLRAVPP